MYDFYKKIIQDFLERNYTKGRKYNGVQQNIEYIVLHYTAGLSSKKGQARENRNYFNIYKEDPNKRSSAHYIVDDVEIIQAVRDEDTSWHCGGTPNKYQPNGSKFYNKCRNTNSIGIEMCSYNTSGKPYNKCYATDKYWFFTDKVINNTIELVYYLMKKYDIPMERVILHYDVTGKWCPAPWLNEPDKYVDFKNKLKKYIEDKEDENMTNETFKKLFDEMRKELQDNDSGAWSKEARDWATKEGLINGNGTEINGEPNCMWQDFLTREQLAAVLYKFYKMIK